MQHTLEKHSPISVHRAFVVHFRMAADVKRGPFEGRVEHVVSGQTAHFSSLEELLSFIAQVLSTIPPSAQQSPSRDNKLKRSPSVPPEERGRTKVRLSRGAEKGEENHGHHAP